METIPAWLAARIAQHGDKPALVEASTSFQLSYKELGWGLAKVGRLLADQSVRPGDVVTLVGENSVDLVLHLFGIMGMGAIAAPLNPKLSAPEMETILEHSGSRHLISDRVLNLGGYSGKTLSLDAYRKLPDAPGKGQEAEARPGVQKSGLLIYTSGTTGKAKGVLLTHGNITANTAAACGRLKLDPSHVSLCILPLFHTFGFISDLCAALYCGGTCVVMETFDVSRLDAVQAAVEDYCPRSFSAVPLMFELFIRFQIGFKDSSLRFAVSGAAPLKPKTAWEFRQSFGFPILPAYGLTETTCFCTLSEPGRVVDGSIGIPLDCRVKILSADDEERELPTGETGELAVQGPNVIQGGYYKDDRDCYARSLPGWFKTGDLGRTDGQGRLYITGRRKNMVIRGGEKIYLEDIDRCLEGMPGVTDCATIRAAEAESEKIICFVVRQAGSGLAAQDIVSWLRRKISAQKCPDLVVFRQEIPRTATHKVRLAELQREAAELA